MRNLLQGALCSALLLGSGSALAAPPEPLIVTQLPDPDPNYVPPRHEPWVMRSSASADDDPTLDEAMQDFGRAIGQAARLQQQAIEARCRSAGPAAADTAARWAWEGDCRYQRH